MLTGLKVVVFVVVVLLGLWKIVKLEKNEQIKVDTKYLPVFSVVVLG